MCCLKDLVWCVIFITFFSFIALLMFIVYFNCINIEESGLKCNDYWERILDLFSIE